MANKTKSLLYKAGSYFLFMFIGITTWAQSVAVTGIVRDATNTPLQGASVLLEGTKKGVVTDVNGAYTIAVMPGSNTIVVTYVGMQEQKQTVSVNTTQFGFNGGYYYSSLVFDISNLLTKK